MNAGPILLWWGSDLRLLAGDRLTRRDLAEHADPVPAILETIAEVEPGGPVWIVCHPDSLETHQANGLGFRVHPGRGGRGRLHRKLARELPALADAGTAWSAAPAGDGLVVYLERHSRLPALARELARNRRPVAGAWPLPLLLASGPELAGRGSLSLVATADRTLVSWLSADGEPGAEAHSGVDLPAATLAALRGAFARFDDGAPPSGWFALEDGPAADALRPVATGLGLAGTSLAELLGRARRLTPGGTADFLAPPAWYARRRLRVQIAAAAGVLLAAGAAGQAWNARAHLDRRRRDLAELQTQARLLQKAEEEARTRQGQIEQIAGELGHLESAPSRHFELLMALARAAADAVVLESVTTQGADFTIAGRTEEGGEPLPAFYRALAAPGLPWTLGSEPAGAAGAHFTLTGQFRPAVSPGPAAGGPTAHTPEAFAQWTSRLETERARLPTVAAFEDRMKRRSSRWIVVSESAEPLAGGELRRYALAYDRPRLDDWSDLVEAVRDFCSQPGLTIERLALTAAPAGAGEFVQAGLSLSVRLRP